LVLWPVHEASLAYIPCNLILIFSWYAKLMKTCMLGIANLIKMHCSCVVFLSKKPRLPHITWKDTVTRDVKPMDVAWDGICLKAIVRGDWTECAAHCAIHWKN